jgi:hypothetical protein
VKTKTATVRHSHRQAISTRYLGPTNHRGARIKVTAEAGALTVSWDHSLNVDENHAKAAKAFADRWDWGGVWIGSPSPDGKGYVFVNLPRKKANI